MLVNVNFGLGDAEMSFWGRLFGSSESIDKIVDHAASGLDKLWYTDEEKSEDAAKRRTESLSFFIEWLRATQGQNLARRFIAISSTLMWLTMYFISWTLEALSPWFSGQAVLVIDGEKIEVTTGYLMSLSAESINGYAVTMNGAMMLILGFYFAAPHLDKIVGHAIERFGERFKKSDTKEMK